MRILDKIVKFDFANVLPDLGALFIKLFKLGLILNLNKYLVLAKYYNPLE